MKFNRQSLSFFIPKGPRVVLIILLTTITLFRLVKAETIGLDTAFGTNGKVVTSIYAQDDQAYSVVTQADGKIVLAASEYYGTDTAFQVVRYNDNGALDNTFGAGGMVSTTFSEGNAGAYAVALQADNKLVVAGTVSLEDGYDFALARYNSDGTLDMSFDGDGKVVTDFNSGHDFVYALTIQPDGKILVAGTSGHNGHYDFALARYNTDGSLDDNFSSNGKMITDLGSSDYARAIIVQPDEKIVLIGYGYGDFALARYNNDGNLDHNFGINGKVLTSFNSDYNYALAGTLQSDGKIVAVGYSFGVNSNDIVMARYMPNGDLDLDFGNGGQVLTDLGTNSDYATAVFPLFTGEIIVTGILGGDFAVMRYLDNGSLDTTFGDSGRVVVDIAGGYDVAHDGVIQTDGKLIIAGAATIGSDYDVALVRFEPFYAQPIATPIPTRIPTPSTNFYLPLIMR